jgi:GWxTD domain-containing protein
MSLPRLRWGPEVVLTALLAAAGTGVSSPAATAAEAPPFSARAISIPEVGGGCTTILVLAVTVPAPSYRLYVTAHFRHAEEGAVGSRDWVVSDREAPELEDGRILRLRYPFRFPAGRVRARIAVQDLRTDAGQERRLEFEVPDYSGASLIVSDLVLGSCQESEDGDARQPWEFLTPRADLRFGDAAPDLCAWARVLDTEPARADTAYVLHYRIRNARGRTVIEETLGVTRIGGAGVLKLRPPIDALTHGRYTLQAELSLGETQVQREEAFEIDESRLAVAENEEKLREVLAYVATNEERIELERTPRGAFPQLWDRFWSRRDPVPETAVNEAVVEFLDRVDHATRRFGTLEPGWRTDRGRIYIQFGPPDREERLDGDLSRFPTLVWYYYGRGLTFVFQDQDGFGAYRLSGRRRRP